MKDLGNNAAREDRKTSSSELTIRESCCPASMYDVQWYSVLPKANNIMEARCKRRDALDARNAQSTWRARGSFSRAGDAARRVLLSTTS